MREYAAGDLSARINGIWAGKTAAAAFLAIVLILLGLAIPSVAMGAECTDTWIGPESGDWVEASSWSAEHVPTESDVVCIPKSHAVTVDSGAQRVETLQGAGELVLTEASLTLLGVTEASNIGTLRLKEGGELGGTGELWIVERLVGAGGLMKEMDSPSWAPKRPEKFLGANSGASLGCASPRVAFSASTGRWE